MITFLGMFHHTVDEKQRVAIPARFRDQIAASGDAILYAIARKDHIAVFPPESWGHFVGRLLAEERSQELTDSYDVLRRQVAMKGEICRLDSQGRIALRVDQLETAGIDKECVVFGNFGVIELWPTKVFDEKHADLAAQRTDSHWREVTRTM